VSDRSRARLLLSGLATYLPGRLESRRSGTGGTDDPRYCYSVWLRHLVLAWRRRLCTSPPRVVAELGPGDSVGIGIGALLCGADTYFGLDAVRHSNRARNLEILDGVVSLFRARSEIPDAREFPQVHPELDSYAFPHELLPGALLRRTLDDKRIDAIARSLSGADDSPRSMVRYAVPWWASDVVEPGSVEMIFSQAVLEHVDDLRGAYAAMASWSTPTGFLSHEIDFRSHGLAHAWNGHWTIPDWQWRIIRGRRPYLINRAPLSTHTTLLEDAGFEVVHVEPVSAPAGSTQPDLARRFRAMSDTDLMTSGAFIQARRASATRGS
jgi:hypothetical protein